MEQIREILFFAFSFIMIGSALGVVLHRNPVKSALFLVAFFVGLAMMFALLGAQFMATVQVLVYVGAIMVLFLFTIMLIAVRDENFDNLGGRWSKTLVTIILSIAFVFQFGMLARTIASKQHIDPQAKYHVVVDHAKNIVADGNTEVISLRLFEKFLLPFEVVSLVLLVGVIGAIIIAKRDRRKLQD